MLVKTSHGCELWGNLNLFKFNKEIFRRKTSDFAVGLCNDRCLGTFFLKWVL